MTAHDARRRWTRVAVALGPAFAIGVVACGVPTGDESFEEIPPAEVPFGLNEPSTTSTTTTTTTSTTTTLPDAPVTTVGPTTTTIALEAVSIYFLSRGELQPVTVPFPTPFSRNQIVRQLESGPPPGLAGPQLQTLIEPGLIRTTRESRGVVTVILDEDVFGEIAARDQRRAIAQIVLTFTGNLRGVGQVAFTLGGEPLRVPKGDGLLSDEGEPVAFADYESLIADAPAPETSTTSTAPTTNSSTTTP